MNENSRARLEQAIGPTVRNNFVVQCPLTLGGISERGLLDPTIVAQVYVQQYATFDSAGMLSAAYPFTTVPPYNEVDPARLNENFTPLATGSAAWTTLFVTVNAFHELISHILTVIMSMSQDDYAATAEGQSSDFNMFREVLLICFVVFLFLFHIVIYHPIFGKAFDSAQQTMSLLLIIPPDVVSKVQSIHTFVKNVNKKK